VPEQEIIVTVGKVQVPGEEAELAVITPNQQSRFLILLSIQF
jgi:hypothetical protein